MAALLSKDILCAHCNCNLRLYCNSMRKLLPYCFRSQISHFQLNVYKRSLGILSKANRCSSKKIFSTEISNHNKVRKMSFTLPVVNYSEFSNSNKKLLVLGIETSCDDTGAGVVDNNGNIIGEALHSQQELHVRLGGILPPLARDQHREHIKHVVDLALERSGLTIQEIDAIATTVKPGLPLSLLIGMTYGKNLAKKFSKPFIPIHHMEAHALTARMIEQINFPFLVLLTSGGHCQLALVQSVDRFCLLGSSIDSSPGDALDKTARRLRLQHIPEYEKMSGGQAIESCAKNGDINAFQFPTTLSKYKDCNFSFSGLKFSVERIILKEEIKHDIAGGNFLPNIADICASYQHHIFLHILQRLVRGFLFCEMKAVLPNEEKILVLSGGVARNSYFRSCLDAVCNHHGYRLVCPPPKLCSDNGVMIAWNGMEKLKLGIGIAHDIDSVDLQGKCPLGEDWSDIVKYCHIKSPVKTLNFLKHKIP